MTYRLMAEWATDAVCRKLGNSERCVTAEQPLLARVSPPRKRCKNHLPFRPLRGSAIYRHGDRTPVWLGEGRLSRSLVCECEAVTAGEVQYAVENLTVNSLLDLRRRTRVGMGTCQVSCAPAVPPGCYNVFIPPLPPSRWHNSVIS